MIRVLLIVATIIALENQGDAHFIPYSSPNDAVAFWPLNDKHFLADTSGNGNHAQDIWGNVTLIPEYAKGRRCGAYEFRGNPSSYLFFPNNGAFDTKRSTTIMAWVCPYGNAGPIFFFDPNTTVDGVQLRQILNGTELYARVIFTKRNTVPVLPIDIKVPALYEWYHWAVVYDFDNHTGYAYLNGNFITSLLLTPGEIATQADAQAGAALYPQKWFNGLLTCIQIYNRTLDIYEIHTAAHRPECECNVGGDPHITTLDGRDYSFQGICWYTLVKDCSSTNTQFEITADLAPRDDIGEQIRTRAVAINVTVGDESVVVDQNNVPSESDDSLKNINIVHEGDKAILTFELKDTTFKVFWTGKKHFFNIEFTGDYYRGKMCGLLGNADGDAKNDFQKPNGVIVKDPIEFGESWKVQGKQC